MTCVNCQNRIEKKLKSLAGIEDAAVDYAAGTAQITYDEAAIPLASITGAIESLGYTTPKESQTGEKALHIIGVLAIILALASLLRIFSTSTLAASFPLAEAGMGYGMLLVIGLLTSIHCIAMCGGINLSQNLGIGSGEWGVGSRDRGIKTGVNHKKIEVNAHFSVNQSNLQVNKKIKVPSLSFFHSSFLIFNSLSPSLLYNTGRLISYTAVGVAVGALGSVITVSEHFRNMILLLAGLLMVMMGVNMLGLFTALRRFTPHLPRFLTHTIDGQKAGRGPLVIGILNGFMPCGPLQAMQLYALSTGSPLRGGVSMFLFCLGTIPLMFALGAAGGILSGAKGSAFSRRAMQAGAVLVAAMGAVMFTNGLTGAGFARPLNRAPVQTAGGAFAPVIQNGVQIVNSTLLPNRYPAITVQQGVPVRWTINAPQGSINGCNNRFIIREYRIQHTFKPGDNVIEFTPEKAGRFGYSCWMSMIRSTITVLAPGESAADLKEPDRTPKPAGVTIPTDSVAVAKIEENGTYQSVEIALTDDGFEPAIVAVQQGLPVLWIINVNSLDPGNNSIIFPAYYTQIETEQGANPIRLIPTADFDFSTADNVFYGYVKVVNNINNIDIDAVKAEVENHETLIYPEAYFDEI
jgi:sulfite exporter TauE/SafE/copper chaperone CopZ/plastocyanin domain-containing protein